MPQANMTEAIPQLELFSQMTLSCVKLAVKANDDRNTMHNYIPYTFI